MEGTTIGERILEFMGRNEEWDVPDLLLILMEQTFGIFEKDDEGRYKMDERKYTSYLRSKFLEKRPKSFMVIMGKRPLCDLVNIKSVVDTVLARYDSLTFTAFYNTHRSTVEKLANGNSWNVYLAHAAITAGNFQVVSDLLSDGSVTCSDKLSAFDAPATVSSASDETAQR